MIRKGNMLLVFDDPVIILVFAALPEALTIKINTVRSSVRTAAAHPIKTLLGIESISLS